MHARLCTLLVTVASLLLAACGSAPHASTTPANLTGHVVLQDSSGTRPGVGLVVTATRQDASRPAATVSCAADGTFRMQVSSGWYLVRVRSWGSPAARAKVTANSVAHVTISAPTQALAMRRPVTVTEVPDPLPPHGVWVNRMLLVPPTTSDGAMTLARALAWGRARSRGLPVHAVLALVTEPGVYNGPQQTPVRNRLAWVIVISLPAPRDLGDIATGVFPNPESPNLVTQVVALIDARGSASNEEITYTK